MTIVVLLVIVAVVGAVGIVLAGRNGQQVEFAPDRPNFELPPEPLVASDVDDVRFAVGLRGYRMEQVDTVMDRLAAELTDRDRQLAELRGEAPPAGESFVDGAEDIDDIDDIEAIDAVEDEAEVVEIAERD